MLCRKPVVQPGGKRIIEFLAEERTIRNLEEKGNVEILSFERPPGKGN